MFIMHIIATCLCILSFSIPQTITAHDVLLEFKAAYFLPTNSCFKKIYPHGGALYGPEITFQFSEQHENWYGFASVDYFSKKGHSIGLGTPTEVKLIPLAFGLKYFVPFCYGDVYVGLGFEPVHVKTINCSPFVSPYTSQWAFGGIAKIGTYIDLPCNFILDLFIDYSFAKTHCNNTCQTLTVGSQEANVNGALFGAGLGYRFN